MMADILSKTLSFGVSGVNGFPVDVEVFAAGGMPMMEIIGLPDTSVRESKNRVNAAIVNCGRDTGTNYRITVNLAPADIKKEGPSFDLPIAVGTMIATDMLHPDPQVDLSGIAFFGELSLDGGVRPIPADGNQREGKRNQSDCPAAGKRERGLLHSGPADYACFPSETGD